MVSMVQLWLCLELGHEFSGFCVVCQRAQNRRDGVSMDTITPVPQSIESLLLWFACIVCFIVLRDTICAPWSEAQSMCTR